MPETMTEHHRKAKVNGGNDKEKNLSMVLLSLHTAYNFLFGTRKPRQMVEELNFRYRNDTSWTYAVLSRITNRRRVRRENRIQAQIKKFNSPKALKRMAANKKHTVKKTRVAYEYFCGDKTPEEIAKMLTDVWIDPKWIIVAVET